MLPFTYPWIVKKHLSRYRTVLDVGAGNGAFMAIVNADRRHQVTGVELFDPYIEQAKNSGAYENVVKSDIRQLQFPPDSFDVVHCSQVVEHLERDETLALIQKMEAIARHVVIIGTPNGHFEQHEYDGNVLQEHHSFWVTEDFEKMGYQVYGQGLKLVYGEGRLLSTGLGRIKPAALVLRAFSYFCSPLVYVAPPLGAHVIAVKTKSK